VDQQRHSARTWYLRRIPILNVPAAVAPAEVVVLVEAAAEVALAELAVGGAALEVRAEPVALAGQVARAEVRAAGPEALAGQVARAEVRAEPVAEVVVQELVAPAAAAAIRLTITTIP